eukprot:g5897.t1
MERRVEQDGLANGAGWVSWTPPPGVYHYLNRPGAEPKWNGGSKWTGLPTARGWVSWTMVLNTTLDPASSEQRLHGAEEPEDAIAVGRGDVGENDEMDMVVETGSERAAVSQSDGQHLDREGGG